MAAVYIIAGVTIFVATLFLDLKTDLKLWRAEKPIDHKRGALVRLVGLIPAVILVGWVPFHNVWTFISITMFFLFTYWTIFDGMFNIKRSFGWWTTGSDDPDDAKLDNILQRMTVKEQKWLKIGGIVLFLVCAIIIETTK